MGPDTALGFYQTAKIAETEVTARSYWDMLHRRWAELFDEEMPEVKFQYWTRRASKQQIPAIVLLIKDKIAMELMMRDRSENAPDLIDDAFIERYGKAMDLQPVSREAALLVESQRKKQTKVKPKSNGKDGKSYKKRRVSRQTKEELYALYVKCGARQIRVEAHTEKVGGKEIEHGAYWYAKKPKGFEVKLDELNLRAKYDEIQKKIKEGM